MKKFLKTLLIIFGVVIAFIVLRAIIIVVL